MFQQHSFQQLIPVLTHFVHMPTYFIYLSQKSNHKVTRVGPSLCHECVSFRNI